MRIPELLAPAGSMAALQAAVAAGADAVYLSGRRFGARKFAENFDDSALARAIDYAHLRGVRVYVTVNTLIRNDELCDAASYLLRLYEIGADAVLIQDLGQAVAVRIVDSGIGIEPEVLPRIGNPLFSTKKTGNGFGIAISRKIVEAHGGSLFIDSVAGVYTKLSIFLPREQKQKREEA